MASLKTRLEKLERRSGPEEQRPLIFVNYHGMEVAGWRGNDIDVWRLPDESDEALRKRATQETGAILLYQLKPDDRNDD